MSKKEWTPSQSDVEWTQKLISALKGPDAIWMGTFGSLSVDVANKTYKWHTMTAEVGTGERIDRIMQGSLGYTAEKAMSSFADCSGPPETWLSEFVYDDDEPNKGE